MRPIEFRAVTENGIFIVPSDSFSLSICDTGNLLVMWGSDGIVDEFPVIKLDQFTGLTDKNGVKIFEGDVLKDDNFNIFGVIYFCNERCAFLCDNMRFGGKEPCSVVGNVNQNPELLK